MWTRLRSFPNDHHLLRWSWITNTMSNIVQFLKMANTSVFNNSLLYSKTSWYPLRSIKNIYYTDHQWLSIMTSLSNDLLKNSSSSTSPFHSLCQTPAISESISRSSSPEGSGPMLSFLLISMPSTRTKIITLATDFRPNAYHLNSWQKDFHLLSVVYGEMIKSKFLTCSHIRISSSFIHRS